MSGEMGMNHELYAQGAPWADTPLSGADFESCRDAKAAYSSGGGKGVDHDEQSGGHRKGVRVKKVGVLPTLEPHFLSRREGIGPTSGSTVGNKRPDVITRN